MKLMHFVSDIIWLSYVGYLDTSKYLMLSWHQSQQRIQIFSVI